MSKKIIHYNLDPIDREGANFNLIWGEKANGKSYQVKHKKGILKYINDSTNYYSTYLDKDKIIEESCKSGSRFILMRRFREEITPSWIESYFSDVDIEKITNGEYNMVTMYRKELFLTFYDIETHKSKRGEKIGYAVALSTEQNFAGGVFLDVNDIIYEEFMSRTYYLKDEANKLMTFYSTVDRKRGTTRLWMVGNTVTRVCPYIQDWGLSRIMFSMKQGEIKTVWLPTEEIDDEGRKIYVKLAIEHCKSAGGSNFVIGTHAKSTNKGEWQSDPQPKLPKSYKEYKFLYRIMFCYKTFKWVGELLQDKKTKDLVWFIKPYSKEINNKTLVFSDIIKPSRYYQRDIYNPSINNDRIKSILETFKENRIFYATDLCGTEFKQSIDFIIRK